MNEAKLFEIPTSRKQNVTFFELMNRQLIGLLRANPLYFILHDLICIEIGRHHYRDAVIHIFMRVQLAPKRPNPDPLVSTQITETNLHGSFR